MKRTILALCILAAMTATAQKAKKGDVPNNAYIVTNEQDTVAMYNLTNHTARTDNPHSVTAAQAGAVTSTNVYKLYATNGNSFVTIDGTNVDVWSISAGVVTNLWITYSEDFYYTIEGVTNRPAGPSFFPFDNGDGDWYGRTNYNGHSYVVGKVVSWTASSEEIPATLNPGPPWASGYAYINYTNMPVLVTNRVARLAGINDLTEAASALDAQKELHRDSFTNVIWQSVFSNGWMWLVAYTNYPAQ